MAPIDYHLCIICQEDKDAKDLKYPCRTKATNSAGVVNIYKEFLDRYRHCEELEKVDFHLDPDVTAETLYYNNACWHSKCKRPFKKDTIDRILEKFMPEIANTNTIQPCKRRSLDKDNCMFCEKGSAIDTLRNFEKLETSENLKMMAKDLQDTEIMVRVCGPDLKAQKLKYHLNCYVAFKNKHRSFLAKKSASASDEKLLEARAMSELYGYIEEKLEEEDYLFYLKDLHQMFVARLQDYGIDKSINQTRLKDKILEEFEIAEEQSDGYRTIIAFPEGMKKIMKDAMQVKGDSYKTDILSKAAKIIRDEALNMKHPIFNGSFEDNCQESYIPPTLKVLISMLLNGINISDTLEDTQVNLSIAQCVLYNMRKRAIKEGVKVYHRRDREPPLMTFLGLYIHQQTRSKKMIQIINKLGLGPTYERVRQIEDQIETAVCEQYDTDGHVVPSPLQQDGFYLGALDNFDDNPSSTTAQSSFHGTSISVFQVGDNRNGHDTVQREKVKIPPESSLKKDLPASYTTVSLVEAQTAGIKVPWRLRTFEAPAPILDDEEERENKWLQTSSNLLSKNLNKDDCIAWAAYFAKQQMSNNNLICSEAIYPLLPEKAASISTVIHAMKVVKATVTYLNSSQIPVLVGDQPLYALGKQAQWLFPSEYGEDKLVMWPGGLHIEMALWNLVGDLLEDMGWVTVLSEANVTTIGTAKSFLNVAHLMRTRIAHQKTAVALYTIKIEAWKEYNDTCSDKLTFHEWTLAMREKSPTFFFWDQILDLQRKILMFIRSHREKNFFLYIQTLKELIPFFFALDKQNYSRWISVHLRDLSSLPEPIHNAFCRGYWVLSRTNRRFSNIPIDQAHEQNNKVLKGSGGVIGLTENPTALKQWMISAPELARIIDEFERQVKGTINDPESDEQLHHQEGYSTQLIFQKHVKNLVGVIKSKGNPFLDHFADLVTLDTRKVISQTVAQSITSLKDVGQENYEKFKRDVLDDRIVSIDTPIKRNNLPLPKKPQLKIKSQKTQKVKSLENNFELMAKMYMAHTRESDRALFFCHESQSFPASLSDNGQIHFSPSKSDLLGCILTDQPESEEFPDTVDCMIIEGAAATHFLVPNEKTVTFRDYARKMFIPYIMDNLERCDRIDIVFDQYFDNSLKSAVREKRGSGTRFKVEPNMRVPKKWGDFLSVNENKEELFRFLASEVSHHHFPDEKNVVVTMDSEVLSSISTPMGHCSHEEADSRMMVHTLAALEEGNNVFMIRTVDTDVLVIFLGKFYDISRRVPDFDVWIRFGVGKSMRNIQLKRVVENLGVATCRGLPFFHAFTGSDTTSSFKGKAKKSCWGTWKVFQKATPVFEELSQAPFVALDEESDNFKIIQKFVVCLYSKNMETGDVNEARKLLFGMNQNMERIPPTCDALLQHTKRSIYQTGIWMVASEEPNVPSPSEFGWRIENGKWSPLWITLPEVSKCTSELIKCNCKGNCTTCSCGKANLDCTLLCKCGCPK